MVSCTFFRRVTKYIDDAYVLNTPCGFTGIVYYYLEMKDFGYLMATSLGCCLIGWLLTYIFIPSLVKKTNKENLRYRGFPSHIRIVRDDLPVPIHTVSGNSTQLQAVDGQNAETFQHQGLQTYSYHFLKIIF